MLVLLPKTSIPCALKGHKPFISLFFHSGRLALHFSHGRKTKQKGHRLDIGVEFTECKFEHNGVQSSACARATQEARSGRRIAQGGTHRSDIRIASAVRKERLRFASLNGFSHGRFINAPIQDARCI